MLDQPALENIERVSNRRWTRTLFYRNDEGVCTKYGARHQIEGIVEAIKKGDVMAQSSIDIPAATKMGSEMTVDSLNDLDLKVGDKVKLIVEAVSVLVIKE